MSPVTLFLLALGVSADAFAVALAKGLQSRRHVVRDALVLATAFGVAQAVMPLLGWLLGSTFANAIAPFDHWIAFGLLAAVGGRMIWEALRGSDDAGPTRALTVGSVAVLAVATSIDALAVGISLAFIDVSVWVAILVIGSITWVLSLIAVFVGHRVGTRFQRPAEVVGGVVLIVIGAQIVAEHLGLL